ncbi:hypothetical protein Tco_0156198 [Tanacetum coccineum]
MENLNLFYQEIGPYSSARGHLTQEEAAKEALAIRISQKFALLEEERPVIETMAYHDKYKKKLEEIWKDKVELDGKIVKEDEEAVKRIKGEALKEKDDPGAFIFPIRLEGKVNENALEDIGSDINTMPYRIFETLGRKDMKKIDRGITMINHTQAEAMGKLFNVLCQVGVTTIIAKFLIWDIPIDRDALIVVGRVFLYTMGSILKTQRDFSQPLMESVIKPSELQDSILKEHTTEKPDRHDPNAQDNTKQWKNYCFHKFITSFYYGKDVTEMQNIEINDMLRIRLREAGSDEEIFTSVAWIRAFNINEPIYVELCHEFYSTYEFDEVCADDELQSKKINKFRLGGRAHNLTLLEFARRLGLYQAVELEEEGFNVYFEGGLRNDDNFNAQDYWTTGYDKIQKNDLWLLSMFDARHQNGYANVAWVIAKLMKRKGAGTQKESQICCDLDTITLRDLIDSEGKLIPEDPQPGVPRVGIPRPSRASMQDLYDRMGRMEIRQEVIKRMEYRQSYHWDRYHGVFEHMAGVYSIPLQ